MGNILGKCVYMLLSVHRSSGGHQLQCFYLLVSGDDDPHYYVLLLKNIIGPIIHFQSFVILISALLCSSVITTTQGFGRTYLQYIVLVCCLGPVVKLKTSGFKFVLTSFISQCDIAMGMGEWRRFGAKHRV